MRRILPWLLVVAMVGGLAYAGLRIRKDEARIVVLETEVSELQSARDEVREKIEALDAAKDSLSSEVERFDDENWRDVVPDVESAAESVSIAVDEAKDSAGDLVSDLMDKTMGRKWR